MQRKGCLGEFILALLYRKRAFSMLVLHNTTNALLHASPSQDFAHFRVGICVARHDNALIRTYFTEQLTVGGTARAV